MAGSSRTAGTTTCSDNVDASQQPGPDLIRTMPTDPVPAGSVLGEGSAVAPPDAPDLAPIAAAVIVFGGRVLMVRRRVPAGELSWVLPAGEVQPGETAEDAAVRETLEETGLTLRADQRLGERIHPVTGRTVVYVACSVTDGPAYVADRDDLAELAWCDRATLVSYVRRPFFEPVQEYFNGTLT